MLTITLRDLQYRSRQFLIAVIGAGLVFALALLLTGVRAGFDTEAEETVDAVGADGWLVQDGSSGPFTSLSALPAGVAKRFAAQPGIEEAAPLVAAPQTLDGGGELLPVNVLGVVPGMLGSPQSEDGEDLGPSGGAVVGTGTDLEIGETFSLSGQEFEVLGTIEGRTYLGGVPVVYLTLPDAQRLAFGDQDLASTVVYKGTAAAPAGLSSLSNGAVQEDLLRPLKGATQTIDFLRILMWLVAGVIIGAVIYLSTLERLKDFAVLKAVGSESRSLVLGLALQAILTSLLAAALAVLLATVLTPGFPVPVTIGVGSILVMAAIALAVGVLASLIGLRKVLRVDPGLAFS